MTGAVRAGLLCSNRSQSRSADDCTGSNQCPVLNVCVCVRVCVCVCVRVAFMVHSACWSTNVAGILTFGSCSELGVGAVWVMILA